MGIIEAKVLFRDFRKRTNKLCARRASLSISDSPVLQTRDDS